MVGPYKIRSSYKVRVINSGGEYIQFGVTIPSYLASQWSGAEVVICQSGPNCLVLKRKDEQRESEATMAFRFGT